MGSTFTTFDFFVFLAGAVWLLKQVTDGDRYHELRVLVLTVILSCVVLYGFNSVWLEVMNYDYFEHDSTDAEHFTLSEI